MKQLLTVMAIIVCASFTTKKSLSTARIDYTFDYYGGSNFPYRIYVNGVLVVHGSGYTSGSLDVPAGSSVDVEAGLFPSHGNLNAFFVDDLSIEN